MRRHSDSHVCTGLGWQRKWHPTVLFAEEPRPLDLLEMDAPTALIAPGDQSPVESIIPGLALIATRDVRHAPRHNQAFLFSSQCPGRFLVLCLVTSAVQNCY